MRAAAKATPASSRSPATPPTSRWYCFASDATGYVAERYVGRLGKAGIGKACVMFRKLADLDEKALVALIKETARMDLVA